MAVAGLGAGDRADGKLTPGPADHMPAPAVTGMHLMLVGVVCVPLPSGAAPRLPGEAPAGAGGGGGRAQSSSRVQGRGIWRGLVGGMPPAAVWKCILRMLLLPLPVAPCIGVCLDFTC